ncbi:IMP cyclohydrolase [Halomicrobium zhouii]|uniref:IMP cyclohydrolase n=2 Tax=Halomicrobium zhouii TaxID=767519 RepID=A0A1I6K5B2_9EURY|nr:IMP cyclohydrolase [Halomicrobium zhouii]
MEFVVVLDSNPLEDIDIYFPATAAGSDMYVGRFVVVSPEVGAYRVSSRSFPNRKAVDRDGTVTVGPTEDAPETDNPYISYNAVQVTDRGAVVGNGSHVDPIAEKLELGYPARDALAEPLLALDFEKDDYDTPRVAGIVGVDPEDPSTNADGPGAVIGTVRRDALLVEEVTEPTLVATYEKDSPESFALDARDAESAARQVYDLEFEHAVCSAGVAVEGEAFGVAVHNG